MATYDNYESLDDYHEPHLRYFQLLAAIAKQAKEDGVFQDFLSDWFGGPLGHLLTYNNRALRKLMEYAAEKAEYSCTGKPDTNVDSSRRENRLFKKKYKKAG